MDIQDMLTTHCLALWRNLTGEFAQEDKDYFDAYSERAVNQSQDFADAMRFLLVPRLKQDGLDEQAADAQALLLVQTYAKRHSLPKFPLLKH